MTENSLENWKVIPGFSIYSVSTYGNVKNNRTQKLRKLTINYDGYITLELKKDTGEYCPMRVHRLVALTFLDNSKNKETVNHKNHIRHDNRLENLEWFTHIEQNNHKSPTSLLTGGKIIQCFCYKTKELLHEFGSVRAGARFLMEKDTYANTSESSHARGISNFCLSKYKIDNYRGFIWKHKESSTIENEIWKSLNINNHVFTVSNKGRVKSKRNIITYGSLDSNGYTRTASMFKSKLKHMHVHVLVATAFLDKPKHYIDCDIKLIVNHKDGIKANNHVENLEWVTYQENNQHAIDILNRGGQRQVAQICPVSGNVLNTFKNIKTASDKTGTDNTSITHVCKGRYKTANKYIWTYL